MLKGLALLLLFRLSSGEVGSPQPVLSGETTYERIPDVTADIDHLTEKITSNEIDSAADELEGYHKEFFEVSAKCGFMFGTRETTVGSVSWNAIKYEDISENIHLFAETCKSLGKDVPNFDSEWENYKGQHGKFYATPAEDSVRRELYFKRKADIDNHNARYREGLTSYSMKLNYFSDMRLEEMSQMVGCVPGSFGNHINISRVMYRPSNLTLPGTVDWRQKGVVSEVKDQGQCGSCWAFSTTGGIEGQWKIHKGRLLSLSEQQLVDCSHRRPNNGCHGGNVEVALTDIFYAGGIESEQSYPYESSDGQRRPCRFDRQKVVATVKGWVDVPSGNEGILQECVANHGPTSVMIHVSESFYHYHQGVFDDPPCVSTGNHAILVVGYGVQNGQEYWLIKNSWGTGWGYGGFGLMSRNKGNQCIIASFANSPVV